MTFLRWLAFCLLLFPVAARAAATDERYSACTDLARTKPEASLKLADRWLQEAPSPSAYHCRAISLFALKRYQEAGRTLEQLATKIGPQSAMIWANVMRQTAKAWQLAGDKAKALISLTQAIQALTQQSPQNTVNNRILADLLNDRSRLYASGGHELYAIQDLDYALTVAPQQDDLLLARSELLLRQGALHQAMADVNAVLLHNPNHVPAQELKTRISGQSRQNP